MSDCLGPRNVKKLLMPCDLCGRVCIKAAFRRWKGFGAHWAGRQWVVWPALLQSQFG
jgi:hypothetical protein